MSRRLLELCDGCVIYFARQTVLKDTDRERMKRAKATIICLTDDIYSLGPRRLSAQLKRNGFECTLVFLQPKGLWGLLRERFRPLPEDSDLGERLRQQLLELCRDSLVVGLNVWTYRIDRAIHVTRFLQKNLHCPVVWGGIHPTCFPEQSIKEAEGICLGEGDISFLRLAEALRDGRDYRQTRGFWFRDGDQVVRNPIEPLIQNLDDLPFQDFEFEDHFVNEDGTLKQMNMRLMRKYHGAKIDTLFSQGCPYKCAFCSNDRLIDLNSGYRRFRSHSVDFFLAELRYILSRYPSVYNIIIEDDAFMFLPIELIREFAEKYKKDFKVPFFVGGVIPASLNRDKLQILIDAGMIKMRVGIQSGNRRIMRDVFMRPLHEAHLIEGSEIAYKNRKKIGPVQYDLIVDNPLEHPEELKDTIRLVHRLKRPYTIALNSLRLLPGTAIHRMAQKAGLTKDDDRIISSSFEHFMPNMLNLTLSFYNITRVPGFWLRYVLKKDFGERTVTMKRYPVLGAFVLAAAILKKNFHNLIRGDIFLLPRPLDAWFGRFFVRPSFRTDAGLASDSHPYSHALPRRNADIV